MAHFSVIILLHESVATQHVMCEDPKVLKIVQIYHPLASYGLNIVFYYFYNFNQGVKVMHGYRGCNDVWGRS